MATNVRGLATQFSALTFDESYRSTSRDTQLDLYAKQIENIKAPKSTNSN